LERLKINELKKYNSSD